VFICLLVCLFVVAGTLRRWGGNVNIRAEYSYAKDRSLKLLDLFQYNQLEHSIKHYQDRIKQKQAKSTSHSTSTPTGDASNSANNQTSQKEGFNVEADDKFPYQPDDKDM
jgi:hypothetical protein